MECLFQFGQIAAPSSGKTSIHPVKLHVCRNKEEHLALKLLWACGLIPSPKPQL